jgi:hypothetical protein
MNGWFPSSRLGTSLQAKLLLCESIIYLLRHAPQAGAWGEFTFPNRRLGARERRDALHFPALRATGVPARRGHKLMVHKTHPSEKLFGTVPHGPSVHPQSMKRYVGGHCPPFSDINWCIGRTLRKTFRNSDLLNAPLSDSVMPPEPGPGRNLSPAPLRPQCNLPTPLLGQ